MFWYWGQEWVRQRTTDLPTLEVPTLKMRTGDFSELLDPTNVFYGKAMVLKDPTTGTPFAGNIIPGEPAEPEWNGYSQGLSAAKH